MSAGRQSSEHSRALRAEGAAFTLLACGLVLAVLGALHGEWIGAAIGLLLDTCGTLLLASVVKSYCETRGTAKAPRPYLPPQGKI